MNRQQLILIFVSFLLGLLIYFGLERMPSSHQLVEKSRAVNFEVLDIQTMRDRALPELGPEQKNYLSSLENIVRLTDDDSVRLQTLQQLSGAWFELGHPELAGYYAERIAEIDTTAERWAIAGSSFAFGLKSEFPGDIRDFCFSRAVHAFENAVSLEPENPEHRINLAICYAEHPVESDPMRGIRSLVELTESFPENPAVRYHLGRFALQTGQHEKAVQRLQEALQIDSSYIRAHCLLAQVYAGTDQQQNAVKHRVICEKGLNH